MFRHAGLRVWAYIVGLLVISASVALHEAAHWGAAALCGIKCQSYSLGFGPGVKVGNLGGTDLYLRSIPLGGYVELPMRKTPEAGGQTIAQLNTAQKVLVFGSGIAANIALGALAIFFHLRRKERVYGTAVDRAWEAADAAAALKNKVLEWLGGQVAIFTIVSRGAMHGMAGVILTVGTLNIALGIGNLLPIPGLDGYRIFDSIFIGGIMSGGHDSHSASATEVVGIVLGLGYLIVPLILGIIPGIVRICRFEFFLYKLTKRFPN